MRGTKDNIVDSGQNWQTPLFEFQSKLEYPEGNNRCNI